MKKAIALFLTTVLLLSCAACSASGAAAEAAPSTAPAQTEPAPTVPATEATEPVEESKPELDETELPYEYATADGLVRITLPNRRWGQVYTDEHDMLFSDGSCAIAVDLYRAKDTLPTIPTADETHKLIFTSAVSADEYVLYLIGYATDETDFASLATAINSISMDKTRITKLWPVDQPTAPKYSIRDTSYTAWVNTNALNVRTGSGTDKSIICQLTRDTKLTVTGEVLNGDNYIGWSRVRLSNGTEGYVSSQFLTTTQPVPQPTRTGGSVVLYSSRGTVYTVYEYSDNNWRTDSGTIFWPASFSTWESASGQVLYDYDPSVPEYTTPQLTSEQVYLYNEDGSLAQTVYLATDGEWYNTSWVNFYPVGNGVWYCGGAVFYAYPPAPAPTEPTHAPEVVVGPPANWQAVFEQSLWANYEVRPERYEQIGDNVYQVYVRFDEDVVPFVVVNAMTGDYHG